MRKASALAAIATMAVFGASCDEKLSDLAGPTPALTVSFSSIQHEIFEQTDAAGRAACTNCHTSAGRTPASNLNLMSATSYSQLVNRSSVAKSGAVLVVPGDPDNSYLVQKLEGTAGIVGQRMPRTGGPYLTPGQMMVIRRWIQEGAPNN